MKRPSPLSLGMRLVGARAVEARQVDQLLGRTVVEEDVLARPRALGPVPGGEGDQVAVARTATGDSWALGESLMLGQVDELLARSCPRSGCGRSCSPARR